MYVLYHFSQAGPFKVNHNASNRTSTSSLGKYVVITHVIGTIFEMHHFISVSCQGSTHSVSSYSYKCKYLLQV